MRFKVLLIIALFFCACSKEKSEKESIKVNSASDIEITQGKKSTNYDQNELKNTLLKKDTTSFYYSIKEKKRSTLDAYKNVRNDNRLRYLIAKNLRLSLSKDFLKRCSACHDDYANGIIGPSLLGKNADFIYEKLLAFKSGKTKNILMQELTKRLDKSLLLSLAKEIASFNAKVQKIKK